MPVKVSKCVKDNVIMVLELIIIRSATNNLIKN